MMPIRFTCQEMLPLTPSIIAEQVLVLTRWPESQGCGPIPGIKTSTLGHRSSYELTEPAPSINGKRQYTMSLFLLQSLLLCVQEDLIRRRRQLRLIDLPFGSDTDGLSEQFPIRLGPID